MGNAMPALRSKLDRRMDELQMCMKANFHLTAPTTVSLLIDNITFAWSVLSEEDRDYVQAAQHAVEEGTPWGVPD